MSGRRLVFVGMVALAASAVARDPTTKGLPPDVIDFIRKDYGSPEMETRYLAGRIDLNADRKPELIVHVVGPMACGTGGCPTLVFTPEGSRHRLVSQVGVSRPPIRAAKAGSAGWRNLIVRIGGGGGRAGDVALRFDGTSYPDNPTVSGPRVTPANLGDADIVIDAFDSFADATPLPGAEASPPAAAPHPERRRIERQIRGGQLEAPTAIGYECAGHEGKPFYAAFYRQTDPPSVVLTFGDRQEIAFATETGSGARYVNAAVDFWEHHGEATVTWAGESFTCVAR